MKNGIQHLKAAFCFSGQLRTWKDCYPTWLKLFQYFDTPPDIFCHIWDFNTPPFSMPDEGSVQYVSQEEIEQYINILRPKSFLVEDHPRAESVKLQTHLAIKDKYKCNVPHSPFWLASQYYGIDQAATLKEDYEMSNDIRYDVVFRMRNDLYFDDNAINYFYSGLKLGIYNPIGYIDDEKQLKDFTGVEPFKFYASHSGISEEFPFMHVGDTFFFCNSSTYDLVSRYWTNLPYIFAVCLGGRYTTPERMLYFYLKTLFLDIEPLLLDFKVKRSPEYFAVKKKLGQEPYNCDI
jgi:hypothetical protein